MGSPFSHVQLELSLFAACEEAPYSWNPPSQLARDLVNFEISIGGLRGSLSDRKNPFAACEKLHRGWKSFSQLAKEIVCAGVIFLSMRGILSELSLSFAVCEGSYQMRNYPLHGGSDFIGGKLISHRCFVHWPQPWLKDLLHQIFEDEIDLKKYCGCLKIHGGML